jgi:hypothetical protein
MPGSGAPTLNIADLEKAISSAVQHVQGQKTAGLANIISGPIVAGRYLRDADALKPEAQSGLQQAAEAITTQVNRQSPGLNAKSIVESGSGHVLIGIVFREQ